MTLIDNNEQSLTINIIVSYCFLPLVKPLKTQGRWELWGPPTAAQLLPGPQLLPARIDATNASHYATDAMAGCGLMPMFQPEHPKS